MHRGTLLNRGLRETLPWPLPTVHQRRGGLVADVLEGAWRVVPPPSPLGAAEWHAVAPLLLGTGGGGLGWFRIRGSPSRASSAGLQLQQAYRLQAVLAALHERQLHQVLRVLRSAAIEPLVIKGWAVARLYPEPGLRPYGDHDLCVRPEEHPAAAAALKPLRAEGCPVDLHRGVALLEDRPAEEIWRRARVVGIGEEQVRVLGPEDQLRHLCWHLLDHGAWRPLWLCDIAVALEARPRDFDWDYFRRGWRRRSEGVACALALAGRLLGVRLEDAPFSRSARTLPQWLVGSVLRQWGEGYRHREPLAYHLRAGSGVLESLRRSWPDPIKATVGVGAPFNAFPRWPFQLAQCAKRAAQIAVELSRPASR